MSSGNARSGETRFINANNVVLHVREDVTGGAERTFAYVNSLGSDLRIWDGVTTRLRGRHLRHDLRGHGLSSAPDGPYSIAAMAADLRQALLHAGAPRVTLVGVSIGGLIAMRLALESPELVEALVVMDTAAKIGTAELWEERIGLVNERGIANAARTVAARWFAPNYPERHPTEFEGYTNMLAATPQAGYVGACHALKSEDLRPRIGEIEAPALVINGAEDLATTPETARELARALTRSGAAYVEIPGAGHLPCVEKPAAVAAAIREFNHD